MSGQLTKQTDDKLKLVKREFNKINNSLAQIAQDESDLSERKSKLTAKKKDVTKNIDEELKEIKTELKKLSEKRIFTLGERNARLGDLKQLGLSSEVEAENKKVAAHIKLIPESILQN